MKKKTVGQTSLELSQKTPDTLDPIELQREMQKDYLDNLIWAVKHAKKQVDCTGMKGHEDCANKEAWTGDFYVEVITKKEKLMQNVLRNYFSARRSCPTPDYNQSVYKFNSSTDDIEYLWTVPDDQTCEMFVQNALKIVPEERQLLGFILDFKNGSLLQLARKLNGENLLTGIVLEGN